MNVRHQKGAAVPAFRGKGKEEAAQIDKVVPAIEAVLAEPQAEISLDQKQTIDGAPNRDAQSVAIPEPAGIMVASTADQPELYGVIPVGDARQTAATKPLPYQAPVPENDSAGGGLWTTVGGTLLSIGAGVALYSRVDKGGDESVNTAPVITSGDGADSMAISVAENSTAVTTITATDADNQTLAYGIAGGADAALFTIDAATGALSFKAAPNFETPIDAGANNVYDVTVQVSDGKAGDLQALAITVTNINDSAPVITSNGGTDSAAVSVVENSTAVTTVTSTDTEGQTPTYSISGGADAAQFVIDASTGALSFKTAPDFDAPTDVIGGDNIYDVVVQASDGALSDTQALTVTVTDVNEAPTITSDGSGDTAAISLAENITAVTTVVATDAEGQTLAYSISGGTDSGQFVIDSATGALSFATAPDFEAPTDTDINNIYDVVVQVSDGASTDSQTISVTITDVDETQSAPTISATDQTSGEASLAGSIAETPMLFEQAAPVI